MYFAFIKFHFSLVFPLSDHSQNLLFSIFSSFVINLYKRLWSLQYGFSLHLELVTAWNTLASPVITGTSESSWGSWLVRLVITWESQVQVVGWACSLDWVVCWSSLLYWCILSSDMNIRFGSDFFMY